LATDSDAIALTFVASFVKPSTMNAVMDLPSFQKSSSPAVSASDESNSLLQQRLGSQAPHLPSSLSTIGKSPFALGLVFVAVVSCTLGVVLGVVISEQYVSSRQQATEDRDMNFIHIPSTLEGASRSRPDVTSSKAQSYSNVCEDGMYSKRTLQLAYELPFVSLFRDPTGRTKYEASSVVLSDDGKDAYAICDSSWAIYKFNTKLEPFHTGNVHIGDPDRETYDSGYEALFIDDGSFYVVRESVQHKDKTYHAVIEQLAVGPTDYTVEETCSTEFEFDGDSKGFEGALAVRDLNNDLVVLGLCEGNHCSEKNKDDIGHGRVVLMRKEMTSSGCQWSTIRTINIPKTAAFLDYSAMALEKSTGRIAVVSQEESQLWLGQLLGLDQSSGLWDIDAMEFDHDLGMVYDFPKNDDCETIYCNVEGVHWINPDMVMAVSDKMKGKGKQSFRCFDKDQSVHVFVFP
jgi:hypothetical protein